MLEGGPVAGARLVMADLPVRLVINDPQREIDGTFDRGVAPKCARTLDPCCDPEEPNCFHNTLNCVYVASGFNQQRLCRNQEAGPVYDHISDVQVSSDGAHVAYVARTHCSTGSQEE